MRARGHRLLRELAPRDAARSAPTRSPTRRACAATAPNVWGLTACDGPLDGTLDDRRPRAAVPHLRGARRGASPRCATTARSRRRRPAARSPFAPEIVVPALDRDARALRRARSTARTASSTRSIPTLRRATCRVQHGRVVPGVGWFDTDYLGIDQGPIVAMIENYRSELVWKTMRKNPHVVRGPRARRLHRRLARREGDAAMSARPRRGSRCLRCSSLAGCAARGAGEARVTDPLLGAWAARARSSRELVPRVRARAIPDVRVDVQQIPWTAAHEKLLTALRRRRDARRRAARQHLDPGVRGARRARAARRARRALADVDRAGDYFPGIWDTNVVDGTRLRRALVRRHARALLPHATSWRAPATTRCPRTWAEWRDAMARDQARRGPAALRDPPADQRVGAAADRSALQTRRAAARATAARRGAFARPGVPRARFDFYLGALPRRPRAAGQRQRDREPLPGVRARLRSRCTSPGRGTSASSAAACPPTLQDAWATAPLPGPDGPAAGRLARRRLEPRHLPRARSTRTRRGSSIEYLSRPDVQAALLPRSPATCRRGARPGTTPALAGDPRAPRVPRCSSSACVPTPTVPEWEQIADRDAGARRGGDPRRARPSTQALAALDARRRPDPREAPLAARAAAAARASERRERPASGAARGARRLVVPRARRSSLIGVFFVAAGARRRSLLSVHRLRHLRARPIPRQPALRRPRQLRARCSRRRSSGRRCGNTLYFVRRRRAAVDRASRSAPRCCCTRRLARFKRPLPHGLLRAGRHDARRGRDRLALPLPPALRPPELRARPRRASAPIDWLGDPRWAMPAIILLAVWKNFGYNMIIFLAGLQSIPEELYEAARIDGAARVAAVPPRHAADARRRRSSSSA